MSDAGAAQQPADIAATDGDDVAVTVLPHESFESFYARELRPVVRLGLALTGSALVAEDLAQDAFFDAYRRWSTIATYDNPGAWVRRAVANRAVSFHRRATTELAAALRLRRRERDDPGPTSGNEQLWVEVRTLPRRQAQVVVLHYVEQLTTAEIARVLGISQPAVKTHLQRGRASLAERMETT